jgi:hypothetical protein
MAAAGKRGTITTEFSIVALSRPEAQLAFVGTPMGGAGRWKHHVYVIKNIAGDVSLLETVDMYGLARHPFDDRLGRKG